MENKQWQAYGTNIIVRPAKKNKIIGDKSSYHLWGEVISVGEDVKRIKVGDTVGFTLYGIKDLEEDMPNKLIFIQDDPHFILGILK